MESLVGSFRHLRCQRQLTGAQWRQGARLRPATQLGVRRLNTGPSKADDNPSLEAVLEATQVPFQGVTHARSVPATPSYFSREPQFNDIYTRVSKLLTKYHHLPTLPPNEAPQRPWMKLAEIRLKLGENIKAAHFARVLRVARRLNLIEPSVAPLEVQLALQEFARAINPKLNVPNVVPIDRFGRALGVGRRKTSTARAWVLEGTGEILVNGRPLSDMFGRVHDRESALWPLMATQRMEKYNVWALVEGGGTTGQAEALTLAVAKALVAHEPALKPTLRKAGCITRDTRKVERKKHGHLKARKSPAWVKR